MGESKTNHHPPGLIRHLAAVMLPVTVTVVIPLLLNRTFNPLWSLPSPVWFLAALLGISLLVAGLTLVVTTIRMFRTIGQGTLVPWDPTQHLVITGVYRYVRNPMISGVMLILFGESLLFGSSSLVVFTLGFVAVNLIYIPLFEEPGLRHRFGTEYNEYIQHIPRWFPRRTPWTPAKKS